MSTFIPVGASDHVQGDPGAPITLLEYGDYECPYCGAAYPILKKLQAHYGDKLRFVFRNFPLSDVHPHAMMAAYTAEGSALQGKFWEVHDLIYEHQKSLSEQVLLNLAKSAGVNVFQLQEDLGKESISKRVEDDFEGGINAGVNGTPGFFVNGKKYDGDYRYEPFKEFLDMVLQSEKV